MEINIFPFIDLSYLIEFLSLLVTVVLHVNIKVPLFCIYFVIELVFDQVSLAFDSFATAWAAPFPDARMAEAYVIVAPPLLDTHE